MNIKYFSRLATGVFLMIISLAPPGCGGGNETDDAEYTALSDTLSELLGRASGQEMLESLKQYQMHTDPEYSIEDFSDGLGVCLDKRRPFAYIKGVSMGLIVSQDIAPLENAGFETDRGALMKVIENNLDTLTGGKSLNLQNLSNEYVALLTRVNNKGTGNVSREVADSLQNLYGKIVASMISSEIHNFNVNENRQFDLAQFIEGLHRVVDRKQTPEFLDGVFQGSNIAEQIAVIEKKGVNVKRETVLTETQRILREDNGDRQKLDDSRQRLNEVLDRIDRQYYDAEDQKLASTDKAIQNIKTGEALINQAKKDNPQIKTSSTGLTYYIENKGDGFITESDTIVVNYVASHLDGKIFDENKNAKLTLDKVTDGLREGLKMIGRGGSATFWIPGNLAYGGHGLPHAGVGPMETVVFEVEVLEVR